MAKSWSPLVVKRSPRPLVMVRQFLLVASSFFSECRMWKLSAGGVL